MGRSRARARRALKDIETRDILRERDRRSSAVNQYLPPDSNTSPPSRNVRGNVNPHQLPARLPPPKALARNDKRMLKHTIHIEKRARLMSSKSSGVLDLTNVEPDIDTDRSAKEGKSCISQDNSRILNVSFSAGFAGYSDQTPDVTKKLPLQCLQSPPGFQAFLHQFFKFQTLSLGLRKHEFEISGYEILFPADFLYDGVSIQAGQRVLVRSSKILVAWAEQAMGHFPHQLHEIVVRIVKSDGSLFDTTFRTGGELMVEPITSNEPVEPDMQDITDEVKLTTRPSKQSGTRARQRGVDRTLMRRENLARKAILKVDMMSIERMMAGQSLTGSSTNRSVSAVSALASDTPQQSNGTGAAQDQAEHEQQAGMDIDMA